MSLLGFTSWMGRSLKLRLVRLTAMPLNGTTSCSTLSPLQLYKLHRGPHYGLSWKIRVQRYTFFLTYANYFA